MSGRITVAFSSIFCFGEELTLRINDHGADGDFPGNSCGFSEF
jgi:hypothetical protein